MYEAVDHCREKRGATGHPFYCNPPQREHGRMMIDMKESELLVFFPEYEKNCVGELEKFREIIPPNGFKHLKCKTKMYYNIKNTCTNLSFKCIFERIRIMLKALYKPYMRLTYLFLSLWFIVFTHLFYHKIINYIHI